MPDPDYPLSISLTDALAPAGKHCHEPATCCPEMPKIRVPFCEEKAHRRPESSCKFQNQSK
jgi:hypothetical protein